MANNKLTLAKTTKNDEFYTQWADIEREVQAYWEFDPDVFPAGCDGAMGMTGLCNKSNQAKGNK
jgi:hypothetical protein